MSQLIDLGKLRFNFAGDWSQSTTYESNDIVKYGGNVYVYTYALSTSANVPTNTTYWALMVEGFKFKGVYNPATAYKIGDGIAYGGKVYVSVLDSTGQTPPNVTYWSQFADGIQYEGTYNNATAYQKNDVVIYGGSVYIAKQDSTGNDPTVTAFWDKFVEGISAKGVYNAGTAYVPGDLAAYGPNIYRAKANTTGNVPTNTTYWEILVTGSTYQGVYSGATTYYLNDIVTYGSNTYRSKQTQSATLPTVSANWELLTQGFSYQGTWSSATAYKIGHVITYGGSLFQAIADNTNVNPTVTATWNKLVYGFKNRGNWATSTQYDIDDVVVWGGNSYIALIPHASTVFETDLAAVKWQKFNSGIRWRGTWTTATNYLKDDIVKDAAGSAYIATTEHTSSAGFQTDVTANKWAVFAVGGANVLPTIQADDAGQSLTVSANGSSVDWIGATQSANTFYVAPHGADTITSGKNLTTPFASIKYACQQAPAGSTIFVKTGTYNEQLPITIPANTAIVGDNQRTVIIQPKSGNSDDGTTPNAQATMFFMSDGSILNKMTFKGMTGWVPGTTAADITTSTIKGVVARLNPSSPVLIKSPYVLECSAIGTGCIGALIDGSVHGSGAKTMIFHGYTVIGDNGVGYWVKDGGKAEIVSCFTYYCYFGYTASGGGFIRALNGNNSYGTWGSTARGFDSSETAVTGTLYGQQLNFLYGSGNINVGDTVTSSAGGTATVTNVQISGNKVYVTGSSGTFALGNTLTFTSGGTGTVSAGALENQKGFVLILNNLTARPIPGASITITGDSVSYVVQSVSGSWTNASSVIALILAQEKPTGSASGVSCTFRYKYSQIRLTGHDFLSIGTGGITTTNYPGTPTQAAAQGNETDEAFPGRVYYVSTDQDGNFRVGEYFRIDQATGRATLNANAFDLAGLTSLKLGSIGAQLGETINEFSSDATLSGNSNTAVPTEYAVKTYIDNAAPNIIAGANTIYNQTGTALSYAFNLFSDKEYGPAAVWSLSDATASNFAINPSTGLLTTTTNLTAGSYTITVRAALGSGVVLTKTVTVVSATTVPLFPTTTFPINVNPSTSVTYTQTSATVASGTVAFTVSNGALPSWLTLNTTTGALSGTSPGTTGVTTRYGFTITATSSGGQIVSKSYAGALYIGAIQGQTLYSSPGTYTWTAPTAVTSVSVVAIGGGGAGQDNWSNPGGSGGGLGWKNNITVVPGQSYTVVVGSGGTSTTTSGSNTLLGGNSYFISLATVSGYGGGNASGASTGGPNANSTYGGGYVGDGGGAGGYTSNYQGGGGAGGYQGRGGNSQEAWTGSVGGAYGGSYYSSTYGAGSGGGVSVYGATGWPSSGNAFYNPFTGYNNSAGYGNGGSGAHGGGNGYYGENPFSGSGQSSENLLGGTYGGGGGAAGSSWPNAAGNGGGGAVRVIWGTGRSFPSTNTSDVTPGGPA
jgi:hypothetical protein